jgi:ABC-type nitrate/sulfonate/bicarbonate transport systems, periplasmic components
MRSHTLALLLFLIAIPNGDLRAQGLKKVRMGIQSTNIGFLPFHLAYHKGFYREQGIDLETIFMSTQAVNAAFVRGDLDYSAAVNGIIQGIVRGAPAKILACASTGLCNPSSPEEKFARRAISRVKKSRVAPPAAPRP